MLRGEPEQLRPVCHVPLAMFGHDTLLLFTRI